MIRTLIVDDHTLVRAGLCRLLDAEADIAVVGQAGLGREAVALCQHLKPDLVVLDYGLPDLDGLEATRQIVSLDAPRGCLC
jgi:DNA-binding NarL/FixJ family response regulator